MKILTVLGARPQFIKAGSISREINKDNTIQEVIVHTGQHYDSEMSDVFFKQMKITEPSYNLGIGGKSHGEMTGDMIKSIEKICFSEKPDIVLVYGDTNSTLAGAIASSKLDIKLAHVEAGLRSFNMKMPEEINRILTDRISNWLFCPTETAVRNLENEGFNLFDCKISLTGDVMQDSAIFYKKYAVRPLIELYDDFILCTIHRAENTDSKSRLESIFEALNEIGKEKQVIIPIHPRTKYFLKEHKICTENLTIINPIGYLEMVWLLNNCKLVLTDSGGLQKEAFFFSKFCLTLRDETEWIELVESNFNVLVGADKQKILETYKKYANFQIDTTSYNFYGNGKASKNILNELMS